MLQLLQDQLQLVDFAGEGGGGAAVGAKQNSRFNTKSLISVCCLTSSGLVTLKLVKKKAPKGQYKTSAHGDLRTVKLLLHVVTVGW